MQSPKASQDPLSEILVRMLDEDGSLVPPNDFIPAAERYHLISAIDRWVKYTDRCAVSKRHVSMDGCQMVKLRIDLMRKLISNIVYLMAWSFIAVVSVYVLPPRMARWIGLSDGAVIYIAILNAVLICTSIVVVAAVYRWRKDKNRLDK